MKSAIQLLFAALVLTISVGCAKSSSEQTKATADSAIAELKTAASQLDAMGTPQSNWSEDSFTKYENLLNLLDAKSNQIEQIDGKDGVIITGTYSLDRLREIVKVNRFILSEKRAEKLRAEKTETRRAELAAKFDKAWAELKAAGEPDVSWTEGRIVSYERVLSDMERIAQDSRGFSEFSEATRAMNDMTAKLRSDVKKLRKMKEEARPAALPAA